MSGETRTLVGFALLLSAHALLLFVWSRDALSHALVWGSLAGVAAVALLLLRRPSPTSPRPIPDTSLATVAVAIGLALLVTSTAFGVWLLLLGAEVTVLGLAGLVRETRAARRSLG